MAEEKPPYSVYACDRYIRPPSDAPSWLCQGCASVLRTRGHRTATLSAFVEGCMLPFLVLTPLSAYQPTEPSEVRALQALYSAAGGAAWSVPASKAWLRGDPNPNAHPNPNP